MRLNLASDLATRDGTATKDALLTNAFVDSGEVYKRMGVNSALATAAGQAQGGIYGEVLVFTINSDTLHSYNNAFALQGTFVL